eukprot:TRINITY_DN50447_c0_g1_i3.p1 TRINITY_DN50447_c0_g1~~TRINITY_DN50447_c0_g1_i3.p1  ORF type:complete len:259 (+),score=-25.52 TRINITY_DN50447_c0_g1_i3:102-779(+)
MDPSCSRDFISRRLVSQLSDDTHGAAFQPHSPQITERLPVSVGTSHERYRRPGRNVSEAKRSSPSSVDLSPLADSTPAEKRVCRRRLFEAREAAQEQQPADSSSEASGSDNDCDGIASEEFARHRVSLRPSPLRLPGAASSSVSSCSSSVVDDEADGAAPLTPLSPTWPAAVSFSFAASMVTPPSSPRANTPPVCPGAPVKAPPRAFKRSPSSTHRSPVIRQLFL